MRRSCAVGIDAATGGVYRSSMRWRSCLLVAPVTVLSACASQGSRGPVELRPPPAASAGAASAAPANAPGSNDAAIQARTPGLFGFVIGVPSGRALVIDAQPSGSIPSGERRFDVLDELARAEADVDDATVLPEQRLSGLEVDLYDGAELVCRARLGALAMAGHAEWRSFDPHSLELPQPPDAPEPTDEAIQRASAYQAMRWLVARLPDDPDCEGATWGRLARLPAPRFAEELPTPELAAPVELLERTQLWKEHQSAFVEHEKNAVQWGYVPTNAPWSEDGSTTMRGRAFRFRGEELVLVGVQSGEPCSFRALVRGMFRRTPRGLDLMWADEGHEVEGLLVDLDGDGRLEVVGTYRADTIDGDAWYWTDTHADHRSCGC